jgi:septum formation topological specificity factor MinE
MSRLIHFFKNRQIKEQVKIRIEMWVVSERLKDGIPDAGAPAR